MPKPTPKSATLTVKRLPLSKLKPHPRNPRSHPAPGSAEWLTLKKSLESDYFDPLVANRRGCKNGEHVLVSGHLRAKVLAESGYTEADCVIVDWDEQTHLARMIAANKLQGENDDKLLAEIFRELTAAEMDLDLTGFTAEELVDFGFLESNAEADDDHAAELIDKAAELQKEWKTERGQIWELGEHRPMCGDSTSKDDVGRLMGNGKAHIIVTDPPYGVDYQGGTTKRKRLEGDKTPNLYEPIMQLCAEFSDGQAPVYLWHSDSKSAAVSAAVSAAGYERRCTIIWNKNMAQFGALGAQYKTKHEPCFYLFKKGEAPRWFGPTNEVTVWDVARNVTNEHHPTEKPVEVMSRPIRNSSEPNHIVLDFFSGSGTTLIACEQLQRKCRAMEIDPGYVAVALQRWADLSGKTPKLIK
jgi:DNA modification methylase